ARANIARAGLAHVVDIRLGKAIDTLPKIAAEGGGPFDFVFIDADKPGNADYFAWALRLAHVGTMIVVDNVVRKGGVIDAAGDANIQGARRVLEAIAKEPRVSATAVQTVGSKGYDGFAIALVTS
ncbi:MAG TPA: class I SAM-dependent methyltransferase, partial [Gemmatimonadaceae bacterium]